jgi:hypothetical protein
MPCTQLILLGRLSLPNKVAQGFAIFIGNPHGSQISGTWLRASLIASRRSVFTRSPSFFGTRVGATTTHCTPNCASCQYSTNPVGPAS